MAVAVEALVQAPPYPQPERHPVVELTEPMARQMMRAQIDHVASGKTGFIRRYVGGRSLFDLTPNEGRMPPPDQNHDGYVMDKGKLQAIGLDIMRQYGFNPDHFDAKEDSETAHSNGTVRYGRTYPSETIKGLSFRRYVDELASSGEPTHVSWSVKDEPALLPINLKSLKLNR